MTPLFPPAPANKIPGCIHGSLLQDAAKERTTILGAAADGKLYALDGESGALRYTVELPAPPGEDPFVVATPVQIDRRLVIAYHTVPSQLNQLDVTDPRIRHRMAVIDLDLGAIDPAFPVFDLHASSTTADDEAVHFSPANALARSALVHLEGTGALGRVAVTFGNSRDIQPWHGWVFTVDLDEWSAGRAPIAASFLSTPENDCGTPGLSGSTDRVCGGGIWSPSGPLVLKALDGTESLVVATGNGAFDLRRGDFANALVQLDRDLGFSPGCDPALCAGQTTELDDACAASCSQLFYPRLLGAPSPRPESGACDGLSLFDCWAVLDWDFGGGTPTLVEHGGRRLLVHGAKDGAVYLLDADHLGTLYDRLLLAEPCGTKDDPCRAAWAGMIVGKPALDELGDEPLILITTFEMDRTHPAGVHAMRITEGPSGPRLELVFRAPADNSEAQRRFRNHPSEIALAQLGAGGARSAWVIEPDKNRGEGRLLGISLPAGARVADAALVGSGMRFQTPLVVGDHLYLVSCETDRGPAQIEGYRLSPR